MSPPAAKRRKISHQFGFPEPILYYSKKNSDPQLLLKLMQTSKYFCFKEFPYTVVKELDNTHNFWDYNLLGSEWTESFNRYNISKQFWITENLRINNANDASAASEFTKHIAVCEAMSLTLKDQVISLDEFKFLSAELCDHLELIRTTVYDENEEIVGVERILENVYCPSTFYFEFDEETAETVNSESTKKMIEILSDNDKNCTTFRMLGIPETFDIDAFFEFMKKQPHTIFYLLFDDGLSDEYVQKLQYYGNKALDLDNRIPISICSPQFTEEYYARLTKVINDYLEKRKIENQ